MYVHLSNVKVTYVIHAMLCYAKSLQSCPTLCDPRDGSTPGSPVPGILQARTLEWVAIPFSNAWKGKVKVKSLTRVRLLATPWTAAHQAPPSMEFSRQVYWNGVPLPSPMWYILVKNNANITLILLKKYTTSLNFHRVKIIKLFLYGVFYFMSRKAFPPWNQIMIYKLL